MNSWSQTIASPGRTHALVLGVALGVRLLAWWQFGGIERPHGDEEYYLGQAAAIAAGEGHEGSFRPPLYSAFLALVSAVAGPSMHAARAAQLLLSLATVALVTSLGRSRFGPAAGLVSGLACALAPPLVHYPHFLWSETLTAALVTLVFFGLDRFDRAGPGERGRGHAGSDERPDSTGSDEQTPGRRLRWLALASVALGLAALTRETWAYFAPVLWIWLGWRERSRAALVPIALSMALVVSVVAPWSVRNTRLHGEFVLVSTCRWFPIAAGNTERTDRNASAANPNWTELEAEAHWRELALEAIRDAGPTWFFAKAWQNTGRLLGFRTQELRFLENGWARDASPAGAWVTTATSLLGQIALAVLGLSALWLVSAGRLEPLLLIAVGSTWLVHVIANAIPRFVVPILPLVALLLGPLLLRAWAPGAWRRAGAAATALLALVLLASRWEEDTAPVLRALKPPTDDPRPDVLLVTIDTLRADHCSLYGHRARTTPHLDRLAATGLTYDTAYAPTGATCPSHATLFTGRSPWVHGLVRNGLPLPETEDTLAERLRAAGYRTGAVVSSFPLSRRFGFAQGFDHYEDSFDPETSTITTVERWGGTEIEEGFDRPAEPTADLALDWIEASADSDQPLFLWVHFFDPHTPQVPPESYLERFGKRRKFREYDAEIAYADAHMNRVIEAFAERRPDSQPLVVVTSDHGEGLMDHGWAGHNRTVYEEETRVPLVISWPGRLPKGERVLQPVHLGDLPRTIAALVELPAGDFESATVDASTFALGGALDPARPIFLQRPYYPDGRERFDERGTGLAVRSGRWKYYEASEEGVRELYDLTVDPGERENLAEAKPKRAALLAETLTAWWREQEARRPEPPEGSAETDPEVLEGLRALGYIDD